MCPRAVGAPRCGAASACSKAARPPRNEGTSTDHDATRHVCRLRVPAGRRRLRPRAAASPVRLQRRQRARALGRHQRALGRLFGRAQPVSGQPVAARRGGAWAGGVRLRDLRRGRDQHHPFHPGEPPPRQHPACRRPRLHAAAVPLPRAQRAPPRRPRLPARGPSRPPGRARQLGGGRRAVRGGRAERPDQPALGVHAGRPRPARHAGQQHHRSGPAARRPAPLPLQRLVDHAAVHEGRALDPDEGADDGLARPGPGLRARAGLRQQPARPAAERPRAATGAGG